MPKTQPESLNSPTRSQFNPAGSKNINNFKQKTDELIHAIVKIIADPDAPAEAKRCAAVARTNYEQACMWAVKATAIFEDSIAQKTNPTPTSEPEEDEI
jgi:hypothetical protein